MRRRVEEHACARAGLLGNPSDGYGGKAIAFSLTNFRARAVIEPAEDFALVPGPSEGLHFTSLRDALAHLDAVGCEDGLRLQRAALRRFALHADEAGIELGDGDALRFRLSYDTDIPRQVGLAGSSAIVIATLRALMAWFELAIAPETLAELALLAEREELSIAAGAMDRVAQAYRGLLLMDLREPRGPNSYRRLDPALLPPLLMAWNPRGGTSSGRPHGDLRARWLSGDPDVLAAIERFRELVDQGVACLEGRDDEGLRGLVDRNFELRTSIFTVSQDDREAARLMRSHGAAAKLCGSGGALLALPERASDIADLERDLVRAGWSCARPRVEPPQA